MAQKVRRVRKTKGKGVEGSKTSSLTSAEQFQLEYAYVIRDLRRVFILAGIMFTLLIILNIFLQ